MRHSKGCDLRVHHEVATTGPTGTQQGDHCFMMSSVGEQGYDNATAVPSRDLSGGLIQRERIPEDTTHRADSQETKDNWVGKSNRCSSIEAVGPPLPSAFKEWTLGIVCVKQQICVRYYHFPPLDY